MTTSSFGWNMGLWDWVRSWHSAHGSRRARGSGGRGGVPPGGRRPGGGGGGAGGRARARGERVRARAAGASASGRRCLGRGGLSRGHGVRGLPVPPASRMGIVLDPAGGLELRKKRMDRRMPTMTKRILCAGVVLLFALGLCRAARFRFQDKEEAVRKEAREQLAAMGITRDAAKAKYPTPEIRMTTKACLMPGETGEVVVRGKFAPGSHFIFQNDNLEVIKESQTGAEYRATLKATAGIGPQIAALLVLTPVTAITARQDDAI